MSSKHFPISSIRDPIRFVVKKRPLGLILVAVSEKGVCAILLGDDADILSAELQRRFPKAQLTGSDKALAKTVAQLLAFVEMPTATFALPLDVRGTVFQQRVWKALCEIPPGTVASYTDIAQRIGSPKAVRAVAGACAANFLAVVIPCHRVLRSDGSLSGYRWGVERKRALLEKEAT